jgi:hypothetical protein
MRTRVFVLGLAAALAAVTLPAGASGPDPDGIHEIGDDVADTPVEIHALHDQQHGGPGGHLPGSSHNVELVGQADITGAAPGRVADVSAFGNYAYLTVRDPAGCSDAGVAVMDISDPSNPAQVGFIDATEGSFPGEGSQVLDMSTNAFTGQVLVFNNELCAIGGDGGVSLWDVTDPLNPQVLTAHAGDGSPPGAFSPLHQIHSAFAWQARSRAFVVIVDNEEVRDVDILEITDPRNPVFLTELDLNDFGVLQEGVLGDNSFLHDMTVQRIGSDWVMLLSYWDGGWVQLNVNDPANPVFLRDSDYPLPDSVTGRHYSEGNAHQAEFSPSGKFIIGTDEDFDPRPFVGTITSGSFTNSVFTFLEGTASRPVAQVAPLQGPTGFLGQACGAVPPAPSPDTVALIERGGCTFQVKADSARAAGYAAVIVFNLQAGGAAPCQGRVIPIVTTDIPFLFVTRSIGLKFLGTFDPDVSPCVQPTPPAGSPSGGVRIEQIFDGWGYVRMLNAGSNAQIDAYTIPEGQDPAFETGFGDLTVHEVAIDRFRDDLAYLSYYSAGIRVLRYTKAGLDEVGHYIDAGGNNFWGVEVHRLPGSDDTLILGSDRDSGLWIFRYTGS